MKYINIVERVFLIGLAGAMLVPSFGGEGIWAILYGVAVMAALAFRGYIAGMNLQTFAAHGYWMCGRELSLLKADSDDNFWTDLMLAPWLAYASLFLLHILFMPDLAPLFILGALISVFPVTNSIVGYLFYTKTVGAAQAEIDQENQR